MSKEHNYTSRLVFDTNRPVYTLSAPAASTKEARINRLFNDIILADQAGDPPSPSADSALGKVYDISSAEAVSPNLPKSVSGTSITGGR